MRRSPSSLLKLRALTAIIFLLILSTLSFAAVSDRIAGPVVARDLVQLPAGVPMKAQRQYDQGRVDPTFKLSYMTLLTAPTPSQQTAIDQLLAQQQDPRSPLYHKWLTPEQYAQRFGLSANDIQKITLWLQSQGFSITGLARGRNWITFSGTAAQVESTFQTEIHNFNVNGEMHFSNVTRPSIPAALSGVVAGIRGLSNFRAKSDLKRRNPQYSFPVPGTNPQEYQLFIAPGDIATMYDIGPLYSAGVDGTGQTLAVVGQTDVYQADLNDFRTGFGLSSISCTTSSTNVITACNTTNFKYVLVNADPGTPLSGDLSEADLDLEWSGAIAYNAQIIYVNAPDLSGNGVWDAWYYAVDNNVSPVITMSYGLCELGEAENGTLASDEAELQKANMQGITFMNSSGDSGAAACDPPPNLPNETIASQGLAVAYPASSPEVTGVGGTMIPNGEYNSTYWTTTNAGNGGSALSYIPENGWNDSTEFGAFCIANPTNSFCSGNGITNAETAQAALGIGSTGGGPSGCTTINGSGDCTGGFSQPSWQTVTISGQSAARFVPDVSLLASPNWPGYIWCTALSEFGLSATTSSCAPGGATGITDSITNYDSIIGGTSASSPIFAGIVTLLNHYLVKNGVQSAPGLGNINPNLYRAAKLHQSGFHQVTGGLNAPGSNTVYCMPGSPGVPPASLECPAAVPPLSDGLFGYYAANADTATGYNLVTGLGSVDAANLASVWESSKITSTTTVHAAPTSIQFGQSVTLTATVTPSTTTGQVSFFNNGSTTPIGSGTLSGGVATLATTALPAGTDSITASYAGDINNQPSTTTTPAVVTVTSPDFSLPPNLTNPASANPGQSTSTTMALAPIGESTFAGNVTYSCTSGLPAGATCAFTPTQINAGGAAQSVTVSVATAGPFTGAAGSLRHANARSKAISKKQRLFLPFGLPLAGLLLVGVAGRGWSRKYTIVGLCLALALAGFLIACGGGSSGSQPVSVSVSPSTVNTLFPNLTGATAPPVQQAQFSASVQNTSNTAVTWSVSGGSGNGTIDSTGLYTAPATLPNPNSAITVTATSQADASKSGTATVNLQVPTPAGTYPITVTVTEAGTTHTTTFNLTVAN